jgi:hypothetical protein
LQLRLQVRHDGRENTRIAVHEFGALLAQNIRVCARLAEAAAARTWGMSVTLYLAFAANVAGLHFLSLAFFQS